MAAAQREKKAKSVTQALGSAVLLAFQSGSELGDISSFVLSSARADVTQMVSKLVNPNECIVSAKSANGGTVSVVMTFNDLIPDGQGGHQEVTKRFIATVLVGRRPRRDHRDQLRGFLKERRVDEAFVHSTSFGILGNPCSWSALFCWSETAAGSSCAQGPDRVCHSALVGAAVSPRGKGGDSFFLPTHYRSKSRKWQELFAMEKQEKRSGLMQKRTLKVALLAVLTVVLVLGMSTVALADQTWPDLPDSITAKYGVDDNQVAANIRWLFERPLETLPVGHSCTVSPRWLCRPSVSRW